ncbi:DNA polymerase IV [Stenotrophomonas ginsengisoli]|uniref:DNA polymerase IV n=1 Tax=Stenotrophomonas ginsengisoli TaxID=336566 RepID=A0A0R0DAR9_9GAMM|nr:DNA polymerase IV [Stenotrophomonas ginsengisoli]
MLATFPDSAVSKQRKIIHVDMDAFYASVEQRDAPALRGQPVVVAWRGARSVVCAASYEARKYGVRSAMPALRAERLCPQAVFVPPDFARYKAVSQQIRAIFQQHTPLVEPLSLDEAYLDVSHSPSCDGIATEIARTIREQIFQITGLTASAGIAPNKFIAKVASDWRKPNGQFVVTPARVEAFLTGLPVARIPGVGKVMQTRLGSLGVETVGQLRELPLAQLQAEFGSWGARLYERARGIDERPVVAFSPVQSISSEDTFGEDLPLSALGPAIIAQAARTWAARSRTERVPHTVVLKLKTADFRILTRSFTPEVAPASQQALTDIALALCERVNLPADTLYRLVGVGLSGFHDDAGAAVQGELFASGPPGASGDQD